MAIKKTRGKHTTTTIKAPVEKARTLWLAGLGAVSIAQKRGGELFSGMTAEGSDFQARAQKLFSEISADAKVQISGVIVPLRARAKRGVKFLGATIQRGIAGALSRLGIPTKADVEELTRQVTALSRKLKTAK
jgi:poly(hydroxyalkanoate) granule-associated protein